MISQKENNKKLSVIIVNYKSEHYLSRCLDSFYRAAEGRVSAEVIIVNNYPLETLEGIKKTFPEIRIIVNAQNGGFGHGNNIGARVATGELLLLLNPDTEILSDSLTKVIAEFKLNPETGVVGSGLITEKQQAQPWSAGSEVSLWDLIKNNLGILSSRLIWEKEKKTEAAWVSGTALFVPRKLFLELGGFDENIFMYFEDVDLCARIRMAGKRIVYFPEFRVLHKCGGSYGEKNKHNQNRHYYDSLLYYFQKHRSGLEFAVVKVLRKLFFA